MPPNNALKLTAHGGDDIGHGAPQLNPVFGGHRVEMVHRIFRCIGALALTPASVLLGGEAPARVRIDPQLVREASGRFELKVDAVARPLTVWYCRPPTVGPDTRVIFVMHGGSPETARHACEIGGEHVRAHSALLLAPEFLQSTYSV